MTGITGHPCKHTGTYVGVDGCQERIKLLQGNAFPPCRRCGRTVTWRLEKVEAKNGPPTR